MNPKIQECIDEMFKATREFANAAIAEEGARVDAMNTPSAEANEAWQGAYKLARLAEQKLGESIKALDAARVRP